MLRALAGEALPWSEMHMVQVARNLAVEGGKRGIDQQVMMSAVGLVGPRGHQFHAGDAEFHGHLARHCRAVRRLDKKDTGARRGRRPGLFNRRRIHPDVNNFGKHRWPVRKVSLIT